MKEEENDKIIEVEGVKLNQRVIETLMFLQHNDCKIVKEVLEDIADLTFLLIDNKGTIEVDTTDYLLHRLGVIRSYFLDLDITQNRENRIKRK